MPQLTLTLLPELYHILQLPPDAPVPAFPAGAFVSITVNAEEISVVCPQTVPLPAAHTSPDWRCLKFEGPFAFDQIGILNAVTGPLAEAGVGIFVISTYNTDHLLVKAHQLELTVQTLQAAGHHLHTS